MKLRIVNQSNNPLPAYETLHTAGMDLRAYLPEGPITLEPMQRGLVPTGLYMDWPSRAASPCLTRRAPSMPTIGDRCA